VVSSVADDPDFANLAAFITDGVDQGFAVRHSFPAGAPAAASMGRNRFSLDTSPMPRATQSIASISPSTPCTSSRPVAIPTTTATGPKARGTTRFASTARPFPSPRPGPCWASASWRQRPSGGPDRSSSAATGGWAAFQTAAWRARARLPLPVPTRPAGRPACVAA
jgi:hypothetical protein